LRSQNLLPLKMDTLLYLAGRAVVALIQALPLTVVARLGRAIGALAYWLDARHRRVVLRNLTRCFGAEKSPAELVALARENFRRLGENFGCAIKTAAMTKEQLAPHLEFADGEVLRSVLTARPPRNVVVAIGHFGNFELYPRFGEFVAAIECATTYRGLRQPAFNRLLLELRQRSDFVLFERRSQAAALKVWMQDRSGRLLGLFADQSAGGHALRLPFLGHDCGTSAAPAVFALRYECALFTGICYRVGLARWRVEAGPEIPTHEHGEPRHTAAIMGDVNRAFEIAVRRDPANWFWVHNRWKPAPPNARVAATTKTEGGE